MNSIETTPSYLSLKLWLLAIVINTVIGTLYLSISSYDIDLPFTFCVFLLGLICSLPFSLPVFIGLQVIIQKMFSRSISANKIFKTVLVSSAGLTTIVFILFALSIGGIPGPADTALILYLIALFAAISSVCLLYKDFKRLYHNQSQDITNLLTSGNSSQTILKNYHEN